MASIKKKFHDLKSTLLGGTLDKDYDKSWSSITKQHKRLKKLEKAIKNFTEAASALSKAEGTLAKCFKKAANIDETTTPEVASKVHQFTDILVNLEQLTITMVNQINAEFVYPFQQHMTQYTELEERNSRMYEYDELTKAVKNPGSMQMTAAEAQRRQKHSETSFKLLNEELKSDFLKVLDFRGTTSTAMIALYFDPLADLFANGSHVIQRGEESLSKNGRNVGEDLRPIITPLSKSALLGSAQRETTNPSPTPGESSHRELPPPPPASNPFEDEPNRSHRPLPSAPGSEKPLPPPGNRGSTPTGKPHRPLPTPGTLVGAAATNAEVQQRVGQSVAHQVSQKDSQAKLGRFAASQTDNRFLKSAAKNSTVQSVAAKGIATAATNRTVQQQVGQRVAQKAQEQETKAFQSFSAPSGGPPLPSKPRQAKALYAFEARSAEELSFQAGDVIQVTKQKGDWWEGSLNGKHGEFPANYVQSL